MILDIARLFVFPALVTFAAASDLFTMTISNRLSLLLAGSFLIVAIAVGLTPSEMMWHIAAALSVLVVAFGLFSQGWIGGGDAKLAAAIALWFGFAHLLNYLIYSALLGGALTLLILQFRSLPLPLMLRSQGWIQRLHDKQGGVPYGIALAGAALLIYPQTHWMKALDLTRTAFG